MSVFSALALVVLALLGVGGYAIASSVGGSKVSAGAKNGPAAARRSARPSPAPSRIGTASTAAPAHASRRVAARPRRPAHAARAHHAAHAARARLLAPLSAVAFGPDGVADGDNPQGAAFAIDGDRGLPWETDWYTTSAFGDLKQGTGLLLDMGRRETITAAEVTLGGIPGADLQLRAGDSPELSLLRPVASAYGAGGATRFRLGSHVHARYVLIWFTGLPLDASGTYQASVYGVRLTGQP